MLCVILYLYSRAGAIGASNVLRLWQATMLAVENVSHSQLYKFVFNSIIERIERQKELVFAYRKDERELFSCETEFRDSKQKLEEGDESISKAFEEKLKNLEREKYTNKSRPDRTLSANICQKAYIKSYIIRGSSRTDIIWLFLI